MKYHHLLSVCTAASALLFSCQVAEMDLQPSDSSTGGAEKKEIVITASTDNGDGATRTSIDENLLTYWSPNEAIKLFSAGETAKFVSENTAASQRAQFRGTISFVTGTGEDGTVSYAWGLYPYREDAYFDEEQQAVVTTLDNYQKSDVGSFADNTAVTIGKSTSLDFSFKSAYSGVKVRFYRDDIVSVTLRGIHGEPVAGKVALGMEPLPVVKSYVSPSYSVTMIPSEGAFVPDQFYYILTLPVNTGMTGCEQFEGFTLTVRTKEGLEAVYTHYTDELKRNVFKKLTEPIDKRIEKQANIDEGISTGWYQTSTQGPNEIWYDTYNHEAVTYTPDGHTGNEVLEIIAPTATRDGIIRFKAPLKETDRFAFGPNGNNKLIYLCLPNTVETINPNSFSGCNRLTNFNIQTGSNLKTIMLRAFVNCGIGTINLPEGLETIQAYAFSYCPNLSTIRIPESVTSIGMETNRTLLATPFRGCTSLGTFSGKYATPDGKALVIDDCLLSFATGGMEGAGYVVPSNVKHIGSLAFEDATIGSVILPEGLKTIYDLAFNHCTNLEHITIPSTVEDLYFGAFQLCTSLQSITILRDDRVLGAKTSEETSVAGYGIFDTGNECPIFVPANTLDWYKYGQYWEAYGNKCEDGNRYFPPQGSDEIWYTVVDDTDPSDAENIAEWLLFEDDSGYQIRPYYDEGRGVWIAELPTPLTALPEHTFNNDIAHRCLKSISLPNTVEEIGNSAFKDCIYLESVDFGNDYYERIGDNAFNGCDLRSVVIPNTNYLGSLAFANNSNLSSIVLPDHIGTWPVANPFSGCWSIISFSGDNERIADEGRCIIDDDKLVSYASASTRRTYTVPSNVHKIGHYAMTSAQFMELILPEGLTWIGLSPFSNCPNLRSLDIPESVTSISGNLVSNCGSIQYVKLKGATPPAIIESTFDDVPEGFLIKIPGAYFSTYINNSIWSPLQEIRNLFAIYQTEREVWYHLVDNDASTLGKWGNGGLAPTTYVLPRNANRYEPIVTPPSSIDLTTCTFVSAIFDNEVTTVPPYTYGKTDSYSFASEVLDFVSLPPTVTEIGEGAFKDCSKLMLLPFDEDAIVTIGDDAFNGCSSMIWNIEDSGGGSYRSLTPLTSIGARAFKGCSSLNWALGFNRVSIGESAFEGSSLPGIRCSGITSLGVSAFKNCTGLSMIVNRIGGSSLTEIKESTFEGCTNLDKLIITTGTPLQSIGKKAFYNCTSLETIGTILGEANIPIVEHISGESAFAHTNIKVLKLPDLKTINDVNAFYGSPITQLELPEVTYAHNNAFLGMYQLHELDLPKIVTMGYDMFSPRVPLSLHLGENINDTVLRPRLWKNATDSSTDTFEVQLYISKPSVVEVDPAYTFVTKNNSGNTSSGVQILRVGAVYVPAELVDSYKASVNWQQALAVAGATVDVIQAMPTD